MSRSRQTPPPLASWPLLGRHATGMIGPAFWTFGLLWGTWQVLLPDAARSAGLSTGPLGAVLSIGFVAGLPAMLVAGHRIGATDAGRYVAAGAILLAGVLLVFAANPPLWAFIAAVSILVAASGVYDVAINAAALERPSTAGSAGMTLLHAAFSFGGAVGAIGGGLLLGADVRYTLVYLFVPPLLLLVAVWAWRGAAATNAHRRPGPPATPLASGWRALLAPILLPFAVLTGMAFLNEGALETWSAFLLREGIGASALVGSLGVGVFHAAMAVSRLAGVGILRLGRPARVLAAVSLLAAAAMSLALVVSTEVVVIVGLAITAFGTAMAAPVALSLASRTGLPSGRISAAVLTIGYGGFLAGPIVIGGLSELFSLRAALAVVPLSACAIAVASWRLEHG